MNTTGRLAALLTTAALMWTLPSPALATIINFESDGLGNPVVLDPAWFNNPIDEAYAPLGAHFFNGYFRPCYAMACPAPSPGIFASSDDFNNHLTVVFDGTTPFVSVSNVTDSAWTMDAFDMGNNYLGSIESDTFPGTAELNLPGIHTISFRAKLPGGLYGIDDLAYQLSDPLPAHVPEPAGWALLLTALLCWPRGARVA